MTFEQALTALKQGKKIRRKYWGKDEYLCMKAPLSSPLFDENNNPITGIKCINIIADDWEIVEDTSDNNFRRGYFAGELFELRMVKDYIEREIKEAEKAIEDLRRGE